jgi:CRP-like cAMP-binding protein
MPDIGVYVEFLKKLHLFRGLSEDQFKSVVEGIEERSYPEPGTVFMQGTPADALYFIYQGRVAVIRQTKKKEIKLATLVRGDYFGEQGLLTGQSRNATVKAEKDTILLVLPRQHFKQMLHKVPSLRSNFKIVITSRQLATQMRFKWLADKEVIYFIARKHPVLLYQSLALPTVLMLPVVVILGLAFFYSSTTFAAVGAFSFVLNLAWMVWKYIDWGNDFYIVTNQRVIWLEKVIGLYDSRNEANISTILSISTETNEVGRLFDYGTVVVRTFSGHIRMEYIRSPQHASAMIEEYWMRTKDAIRSNEQEGIKQAIRAKLGYGPPAKAPAPAPAPAAAKPQAISAPANIVSTLREWWRNAFKMRIEEGGGVTYRKHLFVLFRDTLIQNVAFIILFSAPFLWSLVGLGTPPLWLLAVVLLGILVDLMLWIYEYVDWSNDIYQVTADQIIDINRKPFGDEDRKAAPLENILSTEYKRIGFIGMLFNFGTVFVMVGGAQFNFQDVADPPTVQQDIVRRQQVRMQKKRDAETAGERERLAEWLAMYHRTVEEEHKKQIFISMAEKIESLPGGENKTAAQKAFDNLKKEDAKGDQADEKLVENSVGSLAEIVPDALAVALAAVSSGLVVGFSTVVILVLKKWNEKNKKKVA